MNSMNTLEQYLENLLGEDFSSVVKREKTEFDRLASPFGKCIVLVGAGNLSRQVLLSLRRDGIEPLAFADDNPALQGKSVDGVQVLSHQQAAEKYGSSAVFVITIWNNKHSFVQTRKELTAIDCNKVISAITLRWKYAIELLPFYWLDVPSKTIKNSSFIKSAFLLWNDKFSRQEYLAQLKFRILGDFDSLSAPLQQESYFPNDLFDLLPDERFVDYGAYDGITIKNFLKRQNEFKGKIVAYEPDPMNFDLVKKYTSNLDNNISKRIVNLPLAVGAKH
jgi:hypothetical protein